MHYASKGLSQRGYLFSIIATLVWEFNSCTGSWALRLLDGFCVTHLAIVYFALGYIRLYPSHFGLLFWTVPWLAVAGIQFYVLSHNVSWIFLQTKWSRWYCNFHRPFPWGNYNQPIPVVLTILTFRVWERLSCPQPLSVAACFIGGHTFATYIIHHHWVYFPKYFFSVFRSNEMQATPSQYARHHWGFSLVIFLFACTCDIFKEAAFAAVEFIYTWTMRLALKKNSRKSGSIKISSPPLQFHT
jgi:hypothetical protein